VPSVGAVAAPGSRDTTISQQRSAVSDHFLLLLNFSKLDRNIRARARVWLGFMSKHDFSFPVQPEELSAAELLQHCVFALSPAATQLACVYTGRTPKSIAPAASGKLPQFDLCICESNGDAEGQVLQVDSPPRILLWVKQHVLACALSGGVLNLFVQDDDGHWQLGVSRRLHRGGGGQGHMAREILQLCTSDAAQSARGRQLLVLYEDNMLVSLPAGSLRAHLLARLHPGTTNSDGSAAPTELSFSKLQVSTEPESVNSYMTMPS
jgi:hypothetical protein